MFRFEVSLAAFVALHANGCSQNALYDLNNRRF